MTIQRVTYERAPSFKSALAQVGSMNGHGDLAPPVMPLDLERVDVPDANFIGHCMGALGIVGAYRRLAPVRVLDVGGGYGLHHAWARTSYMRNLDFEWTVLELPNYVEFGRRYTSNPNVRFISEREQAPIDLDLVYLCGVLQYPPDLTAFLTDSLVRDAPFIFIARAPLNEEEVPLVQTVTYTDRVVRHAFRVLPKYEVFDRMRSLGYRLHVSWRDEYILAGVTYETPSMIWTNIP